MSSLDINYEDEEDFFKHPTESNTKWEQKKTLDYQLASIDSPPPDDNHKKFKIKAEKCKVIANDILNKHPLGNPDTYNPRERKKILNIMTEWFKKDDEVVDKEFNEIVNDGILYCGADIENYPVNSDVLPPKSACEYEYELGMIDKPKYIKEIDNKKTMMISDVAGNECEVEI